MAAAALLLADARTPTGGYAHSGGLEAAVQAGLRAADVPAFLRGRLRTVAVTEAALTAAAAGTRDLEALLALDDEALARCPSPALRTAAGALGRGLLRTGAVLYGSDGLLGAYRAASTATPRPVALGVVAAAGGLDPRAAALVALHEDASTAAAAAVKLLPVDGAAAVGWVAALGGELEALAARAADAAAAGALPAWSAPLVERRSLHHHEDTRRLFAS
jgi:urease accessory protein